MHRKNQYHLSANEPLRRQQENLQPSEDGQDTMQKDSDVIGAADSDVEREVEALMERDGEDQEEDQEERPPLAETSANVQRVPRGEAPVCGASGRGSGGTRGRGTGRGSATASCEVTRFGFSLRICL
jgi:hypothetical protein